MSFRMGKTECKLVKSILVAHGFREVSEFHLSIATALISGTHCFGRFLKMSLITGRNQSIISWYSSIHQSVIGFGLTISFIY